MIKKLKILAIQNKKGLTLIEFSIVLALSIALLGLVLSGTGVFGLVDRYYVKVKTQHALSNYSAEEEMTLDKAIGGGWIANGLLGTLTPSSTDELLSSAQVDLLCGLQRAAGKLKQSKRGVALTYGQVASGTMTMGGTEAEKSICIKR